VRILLCDDHKMMRDGLRAILEKEGLEVVGEASNGHEVIELARRLRPEIVVMDISMPHLNGIDATRGLVAENRGVKVIGLSMNADQRYVIAMFKAGAVGYLLKNAASDELIRAVRSVAADLTYVSPSIAAAVVDNVVAPSPLAPRPKKALSPREREVLQLLAEGNASKEIASRLAISVATVESHRRQIVDKLNIHSIAQLTKYAIREGLTSAD
jgi:DNA-binding NarL/FixJ family response regulator